MYLIRPGKYTICAFVSIQLMSPASGDGEDFGFCNVVTAGSFHSINVPSEWGLNLNLDYSRRRIEVNIPIYNTFNEKYQAH